MLEHIDLGGVAILFIIGLIVVFALFVRHLFRGGSVRDITQLGGRITGKKPPSSDGTILCLNIYPDRIVCERMVEKATAVNARLWSLNGKKMKLQMRKDKKEFAPVFLPDKISYPPERMARMMGCLPLQQLKSLRFSLLEQLAPFAPVAALAIAAVLFIVIVG